MCGRAATVQQGKRKRRRRTLPLLRRNLKRWKVGKHGTSPCAAPGQLRMAQFAVIGIDMGAAIKIGEALGYDATGLAELLPACSGRG